MIEANSSPLLLSPFSLGRWSMGTKFLAKASAETFANPSHTVNLSYAGGAVAFEFDGGGVIDHAAAVDPNDPYNGFVEGRRGDEPTNVMFDFIASHGPGSYFFEVFDDNSVDYSLSLAPVSVDLTRTTQHGGFAE